MGVQLEHNREVEPPFRGPDIGDVSGPHPIRRLDRDGAIKGIRRHGESMLGLGGGPPLLHSFGPDAALAHQSGHMMFPDAVALFDQGIPDAGTAVGLAGLSMDHPDHGE